MSAFSEILSQVQTAAMVLACLVVILYILTIIWVIRDAPRRGVSPVKWGIISLIPFIGALCYSALRPPMLISDMQEQEVDVLLRQRELMKYGECGRCSYPVQDDYIMCPNCGARLKNVCPGCGKPLDPEWNNCPYCCTKINSRRPSRTSERHQGAEGRG